MPVLPRHLIDPETFEKTSFVPPDRQRALSRRRGGARQEHHLQARSELLGRESAGQSRACTISTRSASTITAMPAACSRHSSRAPSTRGRRTIPTRWTEGYNIPAVRDGRIVKEEFPIAMPAGMSALVFNTRRPLFADSRVRQALIKLFDFEWINRTLYHGQYARTESYFARSDLSSHGRAADEQETRLARALRERGEAQDHGRHLRFSGQRRLRREPRRAERGAGAARSRPAIAWRRASSATSNRRSRSASRFSPPREPRNGCCSPMPAP